MMTPTLLNKKDNFLTRSRLVPSHDSLVPFNAEPVFCKTRHGLFRELNKVELAVEPSDYSDEALLELIAQRDANALSEIYDRYAPIMYNLIVRIGGMVGWWVGGLVGWWDGGMVGWWVGGLVYPLVVQYRRK